VITGYAMVTPLGDTDETWEQLLRSACAARSWPDLEDEGFPIGVACRVQHVASMDPRRRGRDLASRAVAEALRTADVDLANIEPKRRAVFVGTTMGESAAYELAAGSPTPFSADDACGQVFGRHIGGEIGAQGPVRVYGTACAAGNYALGAAADMVRAGVVDVAVAGGVEPFSRIALLGFSRMRAMTPDRCRPFVAGRRGMQLGEAAAFVVVESEECAERRGAIVRAQIGALGLASDAHHPTAPRADGSGMAVAIKAGLRRTGIRPDDVGWVSAHGTGTPQSDAAEAKALHQVFGPTVPPVSSIKGAIGHAMGAAAAVESVLAIRVLETQLLPPNVNGDEPDPALGLDVVTTPRPASLRWVMNCAYAFGGLNSALLISSPAAPWESG
jgi:3-oxoacyl-[acyl-carrier-protein] synthase II